MPRTVKPDLIDVPFGFLIGLLEPRFDGLKRKGTRGRKEKEAFFSDGVIEDQRAIRWKKTFALRDREAVCALKRQVQGDFAFLMNAYNHQVHGLWGFISKLNDVAFLECCVRCGCLFVYEACGGLSCVEQLHRDMGAFGDVRRGYRGWMCGRVCGWMCGRKRKGGETSPQQEKSGCGGNGEQRPAQPREPCEGGMDTFMFLWGVWDALKQAFHGGGRRGLFLLEGVEIRAKCVVLGGCVICMERVSRCGDFGREMVAGFVCVGWMGCCVCGMVFRGHRGFLVFWEISVASCLKWRKISVRRRVRALCRRDLAVPWAIARIAAIS